MLVYKQPPSQGNDFESEIMQIASVRLRDSDAQHSFNELFSRYHRKAYWLARRIIGEQGEPEDCQDIVNDVFAKIWVDIDKYDSERASFGTWVNINIQFACKDFLRKRKRRKEKVQEEPLERIEERYDFSSHEETTPIDDVDRQMFADEVIDIIKQNFDEMDLTIATLRVWQDMKFREIANAVDLPESTVKTRYRRFKLKAFDLLRDGDG